MMQCLIAQFTVWLPEYVCRFVLNSLLITALEIFVSKEATAADNAAIDEIIVAATFYRGRFLCSLPFQFH